MTRDGLIDWQYTLEDWLVVQRRRTERFLKTKQARPGPPTTRKSHTPREERVDPRDGHRRKRVA